MNRCLAPWAARWIGWACVVVAGVATTACGLPVQLDDNLFAGLSADKLIVLFDAENDVAMAVEARMQMAQHLLELRDRRRAAAQEAARADAAIGTADGPAEAPLADEVPRLRTHWLRREVYLREAILYLRLRLRAQDQVVDCAAARFELAKAQQADKERLVGRQALQLPRFVDQVSRYTARRDRALTALAPRQAACEAARNTWLAARDDLVAHDIKQIGIVGADEVPVWEIW
jgi:hypothetical protein